jgi:hypothetical protein
LSSSNLPDFSEDFKFDANELRASRYGDGEKEQDFH